MELQPKSLTPDSAPPTNASTSCHQRAIAHLKPALMIQRQLHNREKEKVVLIELGIAHQCLSDYGSALEYYQQALALAINGQDQPMAGMLLANIGTIYYAQDNAAKAIESWQLSLPMLQEVGDRKTAAIVETLLKKLQPQ